MASLGGWSPKGLLMRHEGAGRGHTHDFHVGKSVEWLHNRVVHHPSAKYASTFADEASADRAVADALGRSAREIEQWLAGVEHQAKINVDLGRITGLSVNRAGEVLEVSGIRLILVKDSTMPEGYLIRTAFPQP